MSQVKGQLSEKDLAALKQKHQSIFKVEAIDQEGQTHVGYFKKPNRTVLGNFTDKMATGKVWDANQTLFKSCWIGGSEQIETVDELYVGVIQRVAALFEPARTSLEKL